MIKKNTHGAEWKKNPVNGKICHEDIRQTIIEQNHAIN